MNEKNFLLAKELRHELHEHPEMSNHEVWTKQHVIDFLKAHTSLEIVDEGLWFYAIYRAKNPAGSIAFRADFDAIPVQEESNLPYKSKIDGMSHNCGHDGHTATLALLALEINENGSDKDVYFLFQHAEETADGAIVCQKMIKDNSIQEIYGYHNMPGIEFGAVGIRNSTINCASKGMIIHMIGEPTHASIPEAGKNPSLAIAEVIRSIPSLIDPKDHKGLILCTVICVKIGEEAFGVSASEGKLMLTLRGQYEAEMDKLQENLENLSKAQAEKYGLKIEFSYCDVFPETANHVESADKVREVCKKNGISVVEIEAPIRGSEDFGYYTKLIPGALFYVGSGDVTQAHTSTFLFPDEIMPVAFKVFKELIG